MTSTFPNGYALLIAVNESAVPQWALPDVAKDVEALHRVLIDPERCAYAPDNVKSIGGPDATREGILGGLDWLRDRLAADTSHDATAVIYYTGHGHADAGSYFLVPYDANPARLKMSLLRAEDFAEAVSGLQPKRLLVLLDCCHAAGLDVKDLSVVKSTAIPPSVFMSGERGASPQAGGKGLETLAQGAGRAVLNSSQPDEQSWVRKDRSMSIFTYHLIEALTGHAQPQEGAKEVLVSDAMSHVWRRVPESASADWNASQHPDYRVSGNFPIALLLGGKGLAKGEAPPDPLSALAPQGKTASSGPGIGFVDARHSQGAIFGASGNIDQHFGNQTHNEGGVHISGNVDVQGDVVGRDKQVQGDEIRVGDIGAGANAAIGQGARADLRSTTSSQSIESERLFGPLLAAAQEASPDKRAEAVKTATALQAEAGKGKAAHDTTLATLVERYVELVPNAAQAVVSAFGSTSLAGVAGPVTQFVLAKLQRK